MDIVEIKTEFISKGQSGKVPVKQDYNPPNLPPVFNKESSKIINTVSPLKPKSKSKLGLYLMIAAGFLILGGK